MSFSDKLVFFRTRYGLTENELGERMGLSSKIISDWEKDKALPKEEEYEKLSKIFGIKKEFFIDEKLNYKDIENFNKDEYWGIELTRLDCENYIENTKEYSRSLSKALYSILTIPIALIFINTFPMVTNSSISDRTMLLLKIGSVTIFLLLGLFYVFLAKKKRKKYVFVDNGMMYFLRRDDRVYVENVLDQEKPKSLQKIIFGFIFIVLAIIITLNYNRLFLKFRENAKFIIPIVIVPLINYGLNFILNNSLRLYNLKKLIKNQNSYNFNDKNL